MDETIHGLSGAMSGFLAASVWYPLETIRIRLQQKYLTEHDQIIHKHLKESTTTDDKINKGLENNNNSNTNESQLQKEEEDRESKYKDNIEQREKEDTKAEKELLEESLLKQTWRMLKSIIKNEGVKGLYSGISSCLIGSIMSYGVYFFSYQYWKNYFVRHNLGRNVVFDSLCTSFLGALCTAITTNPIWVLNSRMSKSKETVSLR